MAINLVEAFQANTKTVTCEVTGLANLDGYTATLTVKKDTDSSTTNVSETGSINGLDITFVVSASDNDISPGDYIYDITVTNGTNVYTLVQDTYRIVDSVKF